MEGTVFGILEFAAFEMIEQAESSTGLLLR